MALARSRAAALALLACLVLACPVLGGCARAVPGRAVAAAAPVPAGLERFYAQILSWGPCAPLAVTDFDRGAFADPAFDCARLAVPLDHARPDGPEASIAVLRQRATGEAIGSLVVNPGGPGGSGLASVAADIGLTARTNELGERFDVVGFDPRGVGASTPTLDCLTDADWEVERADSDADYSAAGIAATEEENRLYAQRCVERSGGVSVLANVGTRDVARDLDVLRAALGDEQLTFVGYSYGTLIGSTYAEAFPTRVRALVLDGAIDPRRTSEQNGEAQYAGFVQAFDAYATDCARQPGCPLGTDPEQAMDRQEALFAPLEAAPVAADGGTRRLSRSDADTGASAALYSSAGWPELTRGLTELAAGDGTILLHLADGYWGRDELGHYDNSSEAFVAIRCVDDGPDQPAAGVPRDVCAFWPAPPTRQPHVPSAPGLGTPPLVVSTTGDPATPYGAGLSLAQALKGTVLSVDGDRHTASLSGNDCVDAVVIDYLVDLTLPAEGTRCAL